MTCHEMSIHFTLTEFQIIIGLSTDDLVNTKSQKLYYPNKVKTKWILCVESIAGVDVAEPIKPMKNI